MQNINNDVISVRGGILLAQLKDSVPESGLQMGVGDLLHTHVVHKTKVLSLLLTLKLVYRNLSMVDCEEVDQFLVVSNIFVGNFDSAL